MPDPDFLVQRESLNDEITEFIQHKTPGCNQGPTEAKPQIASMTQGTIFSDAPPGTPSRWPLHERKDVMVTPASARRAYDAYQFRRQREIKASYVEKYAAAMKAGTFKPGSVITIAMDLNGHRWIVDGNHTLLAVERFGAAFPLTVEYRLVEDESDAAVLYSTFEARKRTLAAHMVAAGLDESTGVSSSMLARFTTGLYALELDFPAKMPRLSDSASRQALIHRWAEWCKPCGNILAGAPFNKPVMSRSAAVAMLFLTIRYQPETATKFWSGIVNNSGLSPGMPQHTAFNELHNSGGRDTTMAEQFAAMSLAWNAYVDGRSVGFLRVFCGPIKVTVKGTPWNNRLTGTTKTERRS
jgi:hypothetical protein